MTASERCKADGCEKVMVVSLGGQRFCREHFILACYDRLETCTRELQDQRFDEAVIESVRQFLYECLQQAQNLTQKAGDLDNLERARLLDIMSWASELQRRLRRSPRKVAFLPVRLHSLIPGRPWEEETQTQVLSRYGAMVKCEHAVETNQSLLVTRLDTGLQAEARVAWRRPRMVGRKEVGIELLDCENFWGLDWSAAGFP